MSGGLEMAWMCSVVWFSVIMSPGIFGPSQTCNQPRSSPPFKALTLISLLFTFIAYAKLCIILSQFIIFPFVTNQPP